MDLPDFSSLWEASNTLEKLQESLRRDSSRRGGPQKVNRVTLFITLIHFRVANVQSILTTATAYAGCLSVLKTPSSQTRWKHVVISISLQKKNLPDMRLNTSPAVKKAAAWWYTQACLSSTWKLLMRKVTSMLDWSPLWRGTDLWCAGGTQGKGELWGLLVNFLFC